MVLVVRNQLKIGLDVTPGLRFDVACESTCERYDVLCESNIWCVNVSCHGEEERSKAKMYSYDSERNCDC